MSRLSGKEKAQMEAKYKGSEQERIRSERAELVSSGTYRPRSTVFSDKRRSMQKQKDERDIRDAFRGNEEV